MASDYAPTEPLGGGVHRRRQSGRAASEHDDVEALAVDLRPQTQLIGDRGHRGLADDAVGTGPDRRVEASAVFAMIGASPRSEGLVDYVGRDDKGFVVTGEEARSHTEFSRHWDGTDRGPSMLECTRRGVFAIGDVRRGSTKRVAAAVGDGALVVRSIHASLDPRQS